MKATKKKLTPRRIDLLKKNKRIKLTVDTTVDDFKKLGGGIMGRNPDIGSEKTFKDRWVTYFGVVPEIVCICWSMIWEAYVANPADNELEYAQPYHLLWALMWLKQYAKISVLVKDTGYKDEKTFRKWSKVFVERLSYLASEVVRTFVLITLIVFNTHTLFTDFVGESQKR